MLINSSENIHAADESESHQWQEHEQRSR